MATNNYPPIVSKYHSDCTACGVHIRPGDRVNWIKGVKGVTCLGCPMPVASTTNGAKVTTPTSAADPQLQAALADGQVLRARIGVLTGERDELRRQLTALAEAAAKLRDELAISQQVRLAQAGHILQLTTPDLAQIAAEKAATQLSSDALVEAANHALALDDDCPI